MTELEQTAADAERTEYEAALRQERRLCLEAAARAEAAAERLAAAACEPWPDGRRLRLDAGYARSPDQAGAAAAKAASAAVKYREQAEKAAGKLLDMGAPDASFETAPKG